MLANANAVAEPIFLAKSITSARLRKWNMQDCPAICRQRVSAKEPCCVSPVIVPFMYNNRKDSDMKQTVVESRMR